jgi:acyl carrier protein
MVEVTRCPLDPDKPLGPLQISNVSVEDWRGWLLDQRGDLLESLSTHGAILFRGFDVSGAQGFEDFAGRLVDSWMGYRDRASKRSVVDGNVYTSTDTPRGFTIRLHSESSFTSRWPGKIFFYCRKPAAEGGRTPIADSRLVYQALSPELRAPFEKHGVMYVRNFGPGVGMDWRDVFQVSTREELEHYCADSAINCTWHDDDRLRTVQTRPASISHPLTGARVWFNHAMALHASSLDETLRATLLRQHGEDNLPHNTYYGNGEPIDDGTIGIINEAYCRATTWFDWRAGDVLMLDNLLYAHGREAFSGERQVFAAMAEPGSWLESGHVLGLPEHDPVTDVSAEAAHSGNPAAPQGQASGLEDWFLAAVARELELESVNCTDNFVDLGGDSLSAVALLEESSNEFGVEVDLDVFLSADTLDVILEELRSLLSVK